jgi:hypothetical protein
MQVEMRVENWWQAPPTDQLMPQAQNSTLPNSSHNQSKSFCFFIRFSETMLLLYKI